VLTNMRRGRFDEIGEFRDAVMLVWYNAKIFNPVGTEVYFLALEFEQRFESAFEKIQVGAIITRCYFVVPFISNRISIITHSHFFLLFLTLPGTFITTGVFQSLLVCPYATKHLRFFPSFLTLPSIIFLLLAFAINHLFLYSFLFS
jgi:hypothetical protein